MRVDDGQTAARFCPIGFPRMASALRISGAARLGLLLLSAITGIAGAPAACAVEVRCAGSAALVAAARAADASLACDGAHDAISFLASLGLTLREAIPIDIVARLFDGVRPTAAGFYRESDRRVQILGYEEFRNHQTWFNLPIDRALYRGLVAHEVAHAVAARNFRVPSPSIQAKEYIAYVTMLSTLPRDTREKVLSQFPVEGFEGEWQMDVAIYLADPMRFGVRAYRHFAKLGDAGGYVQEILAGRILGGG
ncbi:MAG TPA: DUF6639 family protein [Burkholderiales bacterium]